MGFRVVVWDPEGSLPEGAFIEGDRQIASLESRGVVLLPTDVDLFGRNAVAGVFSRRWGVGWPFSASAAAQRGCPMLLYVVPERQFIHWAARLVPYGEAGDRSGRLRLTTNTAQTGALSAGVSPDVEPPDLSKLGDVDQHGGWTIRGRGRLALGGEGYLGLSLYGSMRGLAVVWSACSQSRTTD